MMELSMLVDDDADFAQAAGKFLKLARDRIGSRFSVILAPFFGKQAIQIYATDAQIAASLPQPAVADVEGVWRERWYGSEPERGSAIVDERGNLVNTPQPEIEKLRGACRLAVEYDDLLQRYAKPGGAMLLANDARKIETAYDRWIAAARAALAEARS